MGVKWRFIDTGENEGIFNMAVDKAILEVAARGLTPPTLRVFRWSPPALSLGYLQNVQKIVDLEKCQELGIDVVKRPTGAGAVFHREELTYSVVASEKDGFPLTLRESYPLINQGIIEAYKLLGVEVNLITLPERKRSIICGSRSGLTDLTYQGKKLIFSVQNQEEKALLQHGSLVIKQEPEIFFSVLRFPSEEIRQKAFQEFKKRTTSLSEIIPDITWQDIKKALFEGFQNALGIEFFEGELSPKELQKVQKLNGGKQWKKNFLTG